MSTQSKRIIIGVVLGLVIICSTFFAGLAVGITLPNILTNSPELSTILDNLPIPSTNVTVVSEEDLQDLEELFQPFWEAWTIAHNEFVDQPLDDRQMMYGAIQGMLESLGDPHTSYMDPVFYQQANMELDGSYEGIGAYVDTSGDFLTIIAPMADSPAEAAGLQPHDRIIAIDGKDMSGIPGDIVIQHVLGPAGSEVILTIVREGVDAPFDVAVTRQKIIIPTVEYEMLENDIAYLRLYDFGSQAAPDIRAALRELEQENPVGLVLDLRGNTGGYLAAAIDVASEFLDDEIVLVERFGDGTEQTYIADSGGLATDIPLVVLINAGSASASEIVAGAIQDLGRGLLVGETSYGKGSVQNWIPLSNDQGAVRVTIARWYTPNDRQINEIGLEPDFDIAFTEEDFENEIDPQLDKAIELLREAITVQ